MVMQPARQEYTWHSTCISFKQNTIYTYMYITIKKAFHPT